MVKEVFENDAVGGLRRTVAFGFVSKNPFVNLILIDDFPIFKYTCHESESIRSSRERRATLAIERKKETSLVVPTPVSPRRTTLDSKAFMSESAIMTEVLMSDYEFDTLQHQKLKSFGCADVLRPPLN